MSLSDDAGAQQSVRRALELQPQHPTAWAMLYDIGIRNDDDALAAEARQRTCLLRPDNRICTDR
jgi:cytochrome c-type biogenesis protein CcmH/NrfG